MQPLNPSTVSVLVLLPVVGWRVYSRARRMVGRQRLPERRPWITLTIFPALVMLLAYASRGHVERMGLLAAGLVVGALLAVYGLRKTLFEVTPQGFFYTPNAHLGIALSLLFIGRIVYRVVQGSAIDPSTPNGTQDFARSPLTLAVFGLLAGYYVVYAIGLIRWHMRARLTSETGMSA